MPDFPTWPGSLIRATACDDAQPSLYMLTAPNEPDETPSWVRPDLLDEPYTQHQLQLVEVIHDEGYAQILANLPTWDDLTDIDKGCALLYAWKSDNEGRDYATDNYPAKFIDHPALTRIRRSDACAYVDGLGFDLSMADMVRHGDGLEMTWDEFHRLYDLALDAD